MRKLEHGSANDPFRRFPRRVAQYLDAQCFQSSPRFGGDDSADEGKRALLAATIVPGSSRSDEVVAREERVQTQTAGFDCLAAALEAIDERQDADHPVAS